MAYKTASWGGCGRHLSPGMSSKVATDGPFEAVLGKTHRTEFSRGKGKPEARLSPPGTPSLLGTRDHALRMLREAITEAMLDGVKEDDHIQSHIKDVEAAIKAVRTDLIDRLPKMRRAGKVITKDLTVTVSSATEETVLAVA